MEFQRGFVQKGEKYEARKRCNVYDLNLMYKWHHFAFEAS